MALSEQLNLLRPPALRADDPLGFLAAVGLVALSEQLSGTLGPLALGWEGTLAPTAVCESTADSVAELGERLGRALEPLYREHRILPAVRPGFPIKKVGSKGSDPMRMQRSEVHVLRNEALERWETGDRWLSRWVSALVAPAGMHHNAVKLTDFSAAAGQMTLRGDFEQAAHYAKSVNGPSDALTSWRRVNGYQGANLDCRAVRTAEFGTDGKPRSYGAPSPTWLALMGIRMWPIADNGVDVSTTGWLPLRLYAGYTRRSLVWPVWEHLLDAAAIRTMLASSLLNERASDRAELEGRLRRRSTSLRGLGVSAVFGSSRRTADQGDGPLGPATRLWASG